MKDRSGELTWEGKYVVDCSESQEDDSNLLEWQYPNEVRKAEKCSKEGGKEGTKKGEGE